MSLISYLLSLLFLITHEFLKSLVSEFLNCLISLSLEFLKRDERLEKLKSLEERGVAELDPSTRG